MGIVLLAEQLTLNNKLYFLGKIVKNFFRMWSAADVTGTLRIKKLRWQVNFPYWPA